MGRTIILLALLLVWAQCVTVIPSYDDANKPGPQPGEVAPLAYQSTPLSMASEGVRLSQGIRVLAAPAGNVQGSTDVMNMAAQYVDLLISLLSCTRITPAGILQIAFNIDFDQCSLMGTTIDGRILADVDTNPAGINLSFENLNLGGSMMTGNISLALPSAAADFQLTMGAGTATAVSLTGTLGIGAGLQSIVLDATGTASLMGITGDITLSGLEVPLSGLLGTSTADPATCLPPAGTVTVTAEGSTLVLRFADGTTYLSIDGSPEEPFDIPCSAVSGLIPGIPGVTPPPAGP